MGYLQALQLLTRAYKAARGVMPKGLDLLKLKQKARQKVIDSKKVINVDFSKGRKFYEEGIGDLIQKGKLFVGKAPKTKKIKPAVDPKLIQQESIKDVYKRLMRSNREAVKGFKKRNEAKKDLGDRLKDYKGDPDAMREGGIISLANGGLTNISQTYDNNPTLQAQYPNKQDYLDLFAQQTTTTTPEVAAIPETTTSTIAPINPIKPIIPIPQSSGDSGGSPPPGGGIRAGINLDYGYTGPSMTLADEGEGTILDEDYTLGMRARDAYSGIKNFVKYNPMNPMFMFNVAKAGVEKAKEFAEKVQAQKALEAEQERQAQINAARAALAYQTQTGEGSGYTGGFDPSTQNYDDPFYPGQTEKWPKKLHSLSSYPSCGRVPQLYLHCRPRFVISFYT